MQIAKRLVSCGLLFTLLATFGCAQQNQKIAALEQENATLKARLDSMSLKLAAATGQRMGMKATNTDSLERHIAGLAIMNAYGQSMQKQQDAQKQPKTDATGPRVIGIKERAWPTYGNRAMNKSPGTHKAKTQKTHKTQGTSKSGSGPRK